jgi:hypothetical protein
VAFGLVLFSVGVINGDIFRLNRSTSGLIKFSVNYYIYSYGISIMKGGLIDQQFDLLKRGLDNS